MNMYGSQIWKLYNKNITIFILHGEKQFAIYIQRDIYLLKNIIQCYPIDIILEKNMYKV